MNPLASLILDANGSAAGQAKIVKAGDIFQLTFPEDALYVLLR